MIISKPKGNTMFALSMFLLIAYGLIAYTAYNMYSYSSTYWYQYVIICLIVPIALFVSIKTVKSFKIITIGKNKITLKYPLLGKEFTSSLRSLVSWEEVVVQTAGNVLKELTKTLEDKTIKLTSQENGAYSQIYSYLEKKFAAKKLK